MHSGISLNWFSESHSEISERFPNSSGNVFNSLLLFYHLKISLPFFELILLFKWFLRLTVSRRGLQNSTGTDFIWFFVAQNDLIFGHKVACGSSLTLFLVISSHSSFGNPSEGNSSSWFLDKSISIRFGHFPIDFGIVVILLLSFQNSIFAL